MINLLPEQEKKILLKEYRFRVIVVALALTALAIGLLFVLMLPSYFLSHFQQQASRQQIAGADQSGLTQNKELQRKLSTLKQKVGVLSESPATVKPTSIIEVLLKNKSSAIRLNQIMYDGANKTVVLKGIAETRNSLQQYAETLKALPVVAAVDLPIASFAKESNATFDIKITIKDQ